MKILRTLLVLLLCAVLPLSGLAASGLTGQCPMMQAVGMVSDGGSAMSAGMTDCDDMKSTSVGKAKGSLCKATAQCQMGSLYHPVAVPMAHRRTGLFSPIIFHYTQSLIAHTPDGLWRPPRAL
jgi:hypothetical protein